jgi:CBS domain-containing protein
MAPPDAHTERMPSDQAAELTVGEVMIARPKTLPGDALVSDVRRAFAQPSVRTVLLAENGMFRGAIERDRLPEDASSDAPAVSYADTDPVTATPAMRIPEAIALLERRSEPRLIVLDEDGATLRGLLCLHRGSGSFCVQ